MYQLKFQWFMTVILHQKRGAGLRSLSDDPAVELNGILPDPDYVYIMLHDRPPVLQVPCQNSPAPPR